KSLMGDSPPVGAVNEIIPAKTPFFQLGRDESYRRLRPLFSTRSKSEKISGEIVVLVVLPKKTKRIVDGTFFGPLVREDVDDIIATSQILKTSAYDELTKEQAERLVVSNNPWNIYVGLTRLRSLHDLSADHFATALRFFP